MLAAGLMYRWEKKCLENVSVFRILRYVRDQKSAYERGHQLQRRLPVVLLTRRRTTENRILHNTIYLVYRVILTSTCFFIVSDRTARMYYYLLLYMFHAWQSLPWCQQFSDRRRRVSHNISDNNRSRVRLVFCTGKFIVILLNYNYYNFFTCSSFIHILIALVC